MGKRKQKKIAERAEVDKAFWVQTGPIPFSFSVVFTEAQWNHATEAEGIPKGKFPYDDSTAARCNFIEWDKLELPLCILQFNIPDELREAPIVGIIAHEVTHAYQFISRWMNSGRGNTVEGIPADHWEMECYFIQHFTQGVYSSWLDHCANVERKMLPNRSKA